MNYHPTGRLNTNDTFKKIGVGFLVVFIVGIFFVIILGSAVSNVSGRTHDLAQAEADKYLNETHLAQGQGAVAICVNVDSDGDGYVSCPYVTKDGVTHPLECAGSMTINSGCRPPKAVFTQPQQSYPIPR